ncbi:SigB/SigF/SigG family RNA polymerase sigma factor [Micromonospora sp. CPCC 205371]|nr:SigB/SigF/SigG family RNA polymerase sigma factor [Micromonospora sp. CPCC 205371]
MRYCERVAQAPATRAVVRAEVVERCLPLAHRLARRYRDRGEPFADLEQVARLGLVKAVNRYDPVRGSFTAFATVTILGELRKHFRDRTWGIRAPRRMQELVGQLRQAGSDLTNTLSRAPNATELADRLHTSTEEVDAALLSAEGYNLLSLNTPLSGDGSGDGTAERGDLIGEVDGELAAVDDRLTLRSLLARLPERERRILVLRFYGNLTQTEIAERCGISQMHVSRLLSSTLTWLRHAMLSDTPPHWNDVPDAGRLSLTTAPSRYGTLTVAVAGEIDRDNADELRRAIFDALARRPTAVLLQMAAVPFIDAAGVAALAAGYQQARRTAVTLGLRGVQPHVRRVLAVARLPIR